MSQCHLHHSSETTNQSHQECLSVNHARAHTPSLQDCLCAAAVLLEMCHSCLSTVIVGPTLLACAFTAGSAVEKQWTQGWFAHAACYSCSLLALASPLSDYPIKRSC
ncbi:hypothetical protein ATANTOWER_026336 [Ataeniobius toweri]|uniref:Uncharacterized protein n=1 Tax=Ataeniobius toweri TaxID=208326 RepID=A0ABU7AU44_9TELE|nr:hypothetical protein [Ataeniobius toweri]